MNPKRVMRLMNRVLVSWIELGKPKYFCVTCPLCGAAVECRETELIFTARFRRCGEEI